MSASGPGIGYTNRRLAIAPIPRPHRVCEIHDWSLRAARLREASSSAGINLLLLKVQSEAHRFQDLAVRHRTMIRQVSLRAAHPKYVKREFRRRAL